MPELKLYTVAELREWLVNNKPADGLSEQVIAPTRAWAIIHNPYVKDDDAIVAAIFEDGQLAAYTAAFPEMIDGKRIWWCTTVCCFPQYAGRSYGIIAVGSLMEAHEPEQTFDRWGVQETVEIFRCLGSQTAYTRRYMLGDKVINRDSVRGKFAYAKQQVIKGLRNRTLRLSCSPYTLRYVSYIDDATYNFIMQHRNEDIFLHGQEMMNWVKQYSFTQSSPLLEHVPKDTIFSATVQYSQIYAVQVWHERQLIGFYMLNQRSSSLHVIYLYYEQSFEEDVFASIKDHFITLRIQNIETENEQLALYLRNQIYFPKKYEERVSLSYPMDFVLPDHFTMQYADGDCFV